MITDRTLFVWPPQSLADTLASEKIWDFFDYDDGLPVDAPILRRPTRYHIDQVRAFFDTHYRSIFVKKGERWFGQRTGQIGRFIPLFTEAVSTDGQSDQQKVFVSNFLAWSFLFDDAVTLLGLRFHSVPISGRHLLSRVCVHLINSYAMRCWEAGMALAPIPPLPRWARVSEELTSIFSIARIVYHCSAYLNVIHHGKIEQFHPITKELSWTLRGITDQADNAPVTVASYMERHSQTAGCRVFLLASAIFELANHGMEGHAIADLLQVETGPSWSLIEAAEKVIILTNDLNAAKDVRYGDDTYLAVAIVDEAQRAGHPLANQRRKLRNPAFHGEVLREYLRSPIGFAAMRSLIESLRRAFGDLWSVSQRYAESGSSELECVRRTVLHWAYGYHISCGVSPRYASAFMVFMQAAKNDYEMFVKAIDNAWSKSFDPTNYS